jgi:hypothetical protein
VLRDTASELVECPERSFEKVGAKLVTRDALRENCHPGFFEEKYRDLESK